MARVQEFRVLVASDGSLSATAATLSGKCFPWPAVRVRVVDDAPAAAIIRAKRARADVIVMGWRGHGTVRRFLVGSVSREFSPRVLGYFPQ